MGVINLSVLVDKIKRKLINGGFITSSDKASKSKFGIVKIGDGITVDNGKISVSASGGTVSLYHWDGSTQSINTEYPLSVNVPDGAKVVLFLLKNTDYPWISGWGFVNPNIPLEESNTGYTTQCSGYSGISTIELMKSKTTFKKAGTKDVVVDILAIL